MTNQQHVARFLVESGTLPVDTRTGVTHLTPLLAAAMRRCSPTEAMVDWDVVKKGRGIPPRHTCGYDEIDPFGGRCADACVPLLGMVRLLIKLGADVNAVDTRGVGYLAISASAGKQGMWDVLMRTAPDLAAAASASCHAGHVLLGACWALCIGTSGGALGAVFGITSEGDLERLSGMLEYLRSSYAARGQSEQLLQQIIAPVRYSCLCADCRKDSEGVTHALWLALGMNWRDPSGSLEAMQQLLSAGCSLAALRLGRQHLRLEGECNTQQLELAIKHATERGEAQQHGDVLVALLCLCCQVQSSNRHLAQPQQLARAIKLLTDTDVDFRDECWWPKEFSSRLQKEEPELCQQGVAVSPLVLASGRGSSAAVEGMLAALREMGDGHACADWINSVAGPRGDLALVAAARRGRSSVLRQLLAAGASCRAQEGSGCDALSAALQVCDGSWDGRCEGMHAMCWQLFALMNAPHAAAPHSCIAVQEVYLQRSMPFKPLQAAQLSWEHWSEKCCSCAVLCCTACAGIRGKRARPAGIQPAHGAGHAEGQSSPDTRAARAAGGDAGTCGA
jgi:hypothetical protein